MLCALRTATFIGIFSLCLTHLCNARFWNEIIDSDVKDVKTAKRLFQDTFQCKDGKLIDASFSCDGIIDCEDGSDENRESCLPSRCSSEMFRCAYGACVPRDFVCDGRNDCADGSDEEEEICFGRGNRTTLFRRKRQAACDAFSSKCTSGECISKEKECDGVADCQDGSDETEARCGDITCPSYLYRCRYGACIQKNQVCDGKRDCADGSDEAGRNCQVTKGQCLNSEFRCNDGNCTDNFNTCDGTKHCPDGSDETAEACIGVVCPAYLYRCAYGACVNKNARCNGVVDCADGSDELGCGPVTPPTPTSTPSVPVVTPAVGCLLPPHPPNGKYALTSGGNYWPNTFVSPSTIVTLTCNDNYIMAGTNAFFSFCDTNKWEPKLANGRCILTCPTLQSTETYDVECEYQRNTVSCVNPVEGTIARLTCKPYYTYGGNRQIPSCIDGSWDPYPAPCDPECGQKIVNVETLVIGGSDAQEGEYPWMVAIYNTSSNQNTHICGGSIISRLYILSAAHCFSDPAGNHYDMSYYTIIAGKYYRDLNKEENSMQIRKIKRLYIHEDYKGRTTKYRDDIAVVEVEKLEMTLRVQPVCLDWYNRYEDADFRENNKAVVAGWGFTSEGANPAEVLKKLIVPFRNPTTCKEFMDADFYQQYYSSDKICAGYKDQGTSVCSGDSGGGLYFRSEPMTYYVRGLVSLAPRHLTGCNSNHFALYTKVSKYLSWIEQITRRRL